jgi:hypothetical protein
MSQHHQLRCLLRTTACAAILCSSQTANAEDEPGDAVRVYYQSTAAEQKTLAALDSPTTLEFIETPLQDVIEFLKDVHNIEIQIDTRALDDVGIGNDTPITRNLRGITLRSAMKLMLKELDLAFVVADEVLLITTPEFTDSYLRTRVYRVDSLIDESSTADDLVETLIAACEADLTKQSRVVTHGNSLAVRTTLNAHAQVEKALQLLLSAKTGEPAGVVRKLVQASNWRELKTDSQPAKTEQSNAASPERPITVRAEGSNDRKEEAPALDPFGGPADPLGGNNDPFGGGAEDESSGGDGAADNPFGS